MGEASPELLNRPVYGMSQAARLLGLRTDGLRRWIDGYERRDKTYAPVIRERRTGVDVVTWGEFIEAGYLREYRAKQVPLQYLRPVIGFLRERLQVQYPLATLQPYTSGRELALEAQEFVGLDPELSIVILGRDGSLTPSDPALAFLDKVEFNDAGDVAERLFPLGRNKPVVFDPERSFGEPTVPTVGVRTEIVAELVEAGESQHELPSFTRSRLPMSNRWWTSNASTANPPELPDPRYPPESILPTGSWTRTASASPRLSSMSEVM